LTKKIQQSLLIDILNIKITQSKVVGVPEWKKKSFAAAKGLDLIHYSFLPAVYRSKHINGSSCQNALLMYTDKLLYVFVICIICFCVSVELGFGLWPAVPGCSAEVAGRDGGVNPTYLV